MERVSATPTKAVRLRSGFAQGPHHRHPAATVVGVLPVAGYCLAVANVQKQSELVYLQVADFESPFLRLPESAWLCSNELAFAVFDGFPVSAGHALVITKRVVETWFNASPDEQRAVMELVNRTKEILDARLKPPPDGYNVGFNAGRSAGQTVPHLHVHVIPRYDGDVADPRGGVRHVIPGKANYLKSSANAEGPIALHLSAGHPKDPIWPRIEPRLQGATEVDILASFI